MHHLGNRILHVDSLSQNPACNVMVIKDCGEGLITRLKKAQKFDKRWHVIIDDIEKHRTDGYVINRG